MIVEIDYEKFKSMIEDNTFTHSWEDYNYGHQEMKYIDPDDVEGALDSCMTENSKMMLELNK